MSAAGITVPNTVRKVCMKTRECNARTDLDANVATNAQVLGNVGNGAGWLDADALFACKEYKKKRKEKTRPNTQIERMNTNMVGVRTMCKDRGVK